jgi:hypothetical protein
MTQRRWTPDEDALLGTDTDQAIANRLGRSRASVKLRRIRLGREAHGGNPARAWTPAELNMLGTKPDSAIALELGVSRQYVNRIRKSRSTTLH